MQPPDLFFFLQRDHRPTSNLLKDLHYLPAMERIVFKVCLMAFKRINGVAHEYLIINYYY